MKIFDSVYLLNLIKGNNVGNPRRIEQYYDFTNSILDIGLDQPCIKVWPKLLPFGLSIIGHIRMNNLMEIMESIRKK